MSMGNSGVINNLSQIDGQYEIQTVQRPDRKKSHWELTMEIDELKKRKNRDLEDIKKLKVELQKMEMLYKKYREIS
jgi:hypothetical protein